MTGGTFMNFDAFEKKAKELGVLGIVVTKDGKEIGKKLWDEQCRRNVYSASKSFTSTAVGIAVKEGLLSLDEKLVDCFAEDLPETVSDNLAKATVKDLLTMCLGQEKAELMGAQRPVYEEEDWVKMSLAFPFVYEPGTKFVYNNVGPYLAGVLVERRAGCDLVSYLYPRLFKPLGIARPTWELDSYGHVFGAGGLFLTMDELHKLGLLYLQNGNWKTTGTGKLGKGSHQQTGGKRQRQLRLWLSVLGRQGKHFPSRRKILPVVHHQSGEKRGYHCYRRMPQRPGTDGCGVYGGISAGINGYIWKMKVSRKTESVFCFLLNI